ncbi:hypothetical protein CYMTET_7317 [Cymbomonas tetramitiformis]|uniref:Uncharacterized protein n=1 Tax=Cymbomonas tetramitiformis TaxID=36881 RepID=A0AAE0LHK7_9CHLO|nr:hypothetical protein CYMTET_7317 [Cymbomonas tetramitiformis]
MAVDRSLVDHLLDESHRSPAGRGMPRPRWMYVPESFLPEEMSMLDSDCLTAWAEVSSSEWFQHLCHPSESTLAIVPAAPFPMAPAATSGHATLGRETGKMTFSLPATPAPGRPAASSVGSRTPLSAHAPPFDPRGRAQEPSAGYADPEGPSDRAVDEESKVEQNVDKLMEKLRKFPSEFGLSKEDKVIEDFSRSISVPEVLWKITEVSLGEEQQEYLEKAAGGVRDDLAKPQRTTETANDYHTRLYARYRTVNFVAKVVPGCVPMTQTEFAYSFWRGLTHFSKVGREMRHIELDLNAPADWEERARREGQPYGVTSAILKVLEIAGDIEATKASKVVEAKVAAWRANAPARLSRQKQQVVAMFSAMSRDEGLDWVLDNLQDEVQSLVVVDPNGAMELAALAGCTNLMANIEAKVVALRSDDPARQ